MSSKNLVIDLVKKTDKDNQTFFVGKLKGPITIDCSNGIAILVFVSQEGEEQIQVAAMDNKHKDNFND